MIYIKDNKLQVKNPADDINKLDGEYYAIACNVIWTNPEVEYPWLWTYYVNLYIPEVYGQYQKDAQNYPMTEVPFLFDEHEDDHEANENGEYEKALSRGHVPQIGDVYRVMFENGDSDSCKMIYQVVIGDQSRLLNKNYIEHALLPSGVIDRPDIIEPETVSKYADMLDLAYFITTGHNKNEITYKDFMPCVLAPNKESTNKWWSEGKSKARNIFCKALGMPFMSYFTGDIFDSGVPINASENYNVLNMIQSIASQHEGYLVTFNRFYNDKNYDWSSVWATPVSPYELYTSNKGEITDLEDIMQKMMITGFCYINPRYTKILYPDVGDLPDNLLFGLNSSDISTYNRFYSDYMWEYFGINKNSPQAYAFPKLLLRWRQQYEEEWLKFIQVASSGINYYNDKKLLHTILLCLTICPYLTYPMIMYYTEAILSDELNASLIANKSNPRDFRSYSTYIESDDDFTNIAVKLRDIAKTCSSTKSYSTYIDKFKEIAKNIFGDGLIWDTMELKDINPWTYYDMDSKFARLKAKLPKYLEKIV